MTLIDLKSKVASLGMIAREILPRPDQTEEEARKNRVPTGNLPCHPIGVIQIGTIEKKHVQVLESKISHALDSIEEIFCLKAWGNTPDEAWSHLNNEAVKAA